MNWTIATMLWALQPAPSTANDAVTMRFDCAAPAANPAAEAPNLHGNWDIVMDVGGEPSFGLMSIGIVGSGYGGSLTPARTAPVVVRDILVTGNRVHMTVASREGDVLFDGRISAKGDRMCGTVTYHRGGTFPMIAQKRPSTYRAAAQVDGAR